MLAMNENSKKPEFLPFKELKRMIPCAICQQPSTGRHYGVFSCGGCRNFFKRSLNLEMSYRCLHSGVVSPLSCRKCRFQKCLAVGMSLEAISIGRPTDKDKCALSSFMRDKILGINEPQEGESKPIEAKQQPNDQIDFQTFKQKLFDSVGRLLKLKPNMNSQLQLSWPVSQISSTITRSIENNIRQMGKHFKTMPGMGETIRTADKISIFSNSLFKLLTFKAILQSDNPLGSLFNVDQQSLSVLNNFFPKYFISIELAMSSLVFDFETNNFSEEERCIIYALIMFDQNLMKNCESYQNLVQISLSINRMNSTDNQRNGLVLAFAEKFKQIHLPMLTFFQHLFHLQIDCNSTVLLCEVLEACNK